MVDAVKKQAETMDFAPTFQMGHPLAFEYAHRLSTEMLPGKVRGLARISLVQPSIVELS